MQHSKSNRDSFSNATFGALSAMVGAAALLASAGCGTKEIESKKDTSHAHSSHDHGGHADHSGHGMAASDAMLMVSTKPNPATAGTPATLNMMIHKADGSMVRNFEVTHDKLVHLIIVSDGLEHFAHLHPEVDRSGNLTTEFTFPSGGKYRLFADHKGSGDSAATARGELQVQGEAGRAPELLPNVPGMVRGEELSANITLDASQSDSVRVSFRIADSNGGPVTDLEPYLGAMGHLVIISADGSKYVHAHPNESSQGESGEVSFQAHFTSPGTYKGWGQFQRAGKVHTIPFVAKID